MTGQPPQQSYPIVEDRAGVWTELRVHYFELVVGKSHVILVLKRRSPDHGTAVADQEQGTKQESTGIKVETNLRCEISDLNYT